MKPFLMLLFDERNVKEMITYFQRIMGIPGSEVIFAKSPQAKGRVEKLNHTL